MRPRTVTSRRSCATRSESRSSSGSAPAPRRPTTRPPSAARWCVPAASTRRRTRSRRCGSCRTRRSGSGSPATSHAAHPGDARIAYELRAARQDAAGHEDLAVPLYEQALAAGLREPHRHRAQVQLASSLRNLGRFDEAVAVIDDVAARHPDSLGVAAFRALVRHDAGDADESPGRPPRRGRGRQHRPGRRALPAGAHGGRDRPGRAGSGLGAPTSSARGRGPRCRRTPWPPPSSPQGPCRGRRPSPWCASRAGPAGSSPRARTSRPRAGRP